MRTNFIVSKQAAHTNPAHHQYVPALGYVHHGIAPELPRNYHKPSARGCAPPADTKDGSFHFLKPPNGHPDIAMAWNGKVGCWMSPRPDQSNRLGWSPDHLKNAGWSYVGPRLEKK